MTLYVTILNGEGRAVERIPFQDDPGPGTLGFVGDMTVKGAPHVTEGRTDDVVIVTHNTSNIFICSRV